MLDVAAQYILHDPCMYSYIASSASSEHVEDIAIQIQSITLINSQ